MTAELTSEHMIGRDFGGRYRIEAEIGRGGIGVVYRAINHKLDQPVALKVLRSEAMASAQRSRFEREAKALAALRHPNIVAILDCGVSESMPFLVMELLEGESLAQALGSRPMPLERSERVIRELLAALSYVHTCGLVHRDLKPGNVFLQRVPGGGEQVKLLDFGLAKFVDREAGGDPTTLTHSGEVFGTPAYMPPEQWTGQAVDARADVYSAAVVCFEMLAGRKPFAGEGQDLLRRQLIEAAPLLHEACAERVAHPELERLLQRALATQARDRQRTATDLAAELEALPRPWLYSGKEATAERRSAAQAVRAALEIATAPTIEQRTPEPAAPVSSARRTRPRRNPFVRVAQAIRELLRRIVLAGAWTLTAVSVFAIGAAAAIIYISHSPDHVEQRAALERALPPLRDAVMRGAAAAKTAVEQAVSDTKEPQPALRERDPWQDPIPQALRKLKTKIDAGQGADERTFSELGRYNDEHPRDPRGQLLLARLLVTRGAWTEAMTQYQQAFARDSSSRTDPRMLQDLLHAVAIDASSSRASELIRTMYGRDALDALARARLHARSPDERARFDRLASTLSP